MMDFIFSNFIFIYFGKYIMVSNFSKINLLQGWTMVVRGKPPWVTAVAGTTDPNRDCLLLHLQLSWPIGSVCFKK
jgi:hypothetical protein